MASLPTHDIEAQLPTPPPPPPANHEAGLPAQRGWLWRLEENDRSLESAAQSLMVVATIIVGFALTAGLNPPGGVLSEPYKNYDQYIRPGKAVLAVTNRWLYEMYYLWVTVALACSVTVLGCVVSGLPISRRVFIIVLRLVTTASMIAILLAHSFSIAAFTPLDVYGPDTVMITLQYTMFAMATLVVVIFLAHVVRFIVRGRGGGGGRERA